MLRRALSLLIVLSFMPVAVYEINCSATCAVVIDCDTRTVLYNKNAYDERPMASTTKIMTAILAIESGKLDDIVTITDEMIAVEGTSLGLKSGDVISLGDIVTGMMLTSGNDSANAVALYLDGSFEAFAKRMNDKAKELLMQKSLFVTPSGLDSGNHHTSAYDMAILTAYCLDNEFFANAVSLQSAELSVNGKSVKVYNHNKLLAMDGDIFGVKTGFTKKSGRCLVSAKHYENNRIICVTLNAPDDWNDHLALYKECEKCYNSITVNNSFTINAVGSNAQSVTAGYEGEYLLVKEPEIKEYYYPFVYAPASHGERIGWAYIYSGKTLIERLPIEVDGELEYAWEE